MVDLLEALTIFCFGLSWPISIRKSIVSRTAKGKSLFFEVFLLIGYACGIARKFIQVADGSSGFLFYLSFFFYVLIWLQHRPPPKPKPAAKHTPQGHPKAPLRGIVLLHGFRPFAVTLVIARE